MEMEQALRDLRTARAAGRSPSQPTNFTPLEIAAAEQLIHLSGSSCSSGAAFTPQGSVTAASACYSSSSPRSVNAPPAGPACDHLLLLVDADDDEQEVGWRPRRNRRYRLITEIYEATESCGERRRKTKAGAGAGGTMEQRRK